MLFEAAYYCEIMRAGIQSIPRGQVLAGYALGLNYWQTMGNIVLPQAFRNMLPMLLTQTIILFQDTSLVYVLSVTDFLGAAVEGRPARRPPGGDVHLRRGGLFHHLVLAVAAGEAAAAKHRHRPLRHPMIIEIKNVSKWYGSFQVLTDCTTKVAKGEVVVVAGRRDRASRR